MSAAISLDLRRGPRPKEKYGFESHRKIKGPICRFSKILEKKRNSSKPAKERLAVTEGGRQKQSLGASLPLKDREYTEQTGFVHKERIYKI